jgi:hypothetical protein
MVGCLHVPLNFLLKVLRIPSEELMLTLDRLFIHKRVDPSSMRPFTMGVS